jgi:type IV secretory pathway VirB10-like protein
VVSEPDRTRSERGAEPVAALRLRSEGPPVMRLSRKVLTGLVGVGAIVVFGALIWALYQGNRRAGGGPELYNTENKTTPDGLSALPKDYSGLPQDKPQPVVPVLGAPVPGDIGRTAVNPQPGPGIVDPEQQRIAQETEAARTSRLFATTGTRERSAAGALTGPGTVQKTALAGQTDAAPLDPGALLNMQDRKVAFMNGTVDRKNVSPDRLENPASRYVVQAGSVIPAALVTGLRSDLPGQVTAQVTENVYDSLSGSYLLIPQGSKLVGAYDSQVSFGQNRLLLVWTRLILSDGRSIVLERQPGADPEGYAGLEDEVDQHWGRLAMAAALSTVIGIGTELGSNANDSAIASALRQGSSNSLSQSGQQITQRNLNIQPTITIRPGFPVRVIINRDLVLAPYQN